MQSDVGFFMAVWGLRVEDYEEYHATAISQPPHTISYQELGAHMLG
jgi:hypothetical protein